MKHRVGVLALAVIVAVGALFVVESFLDAWLAQGLMMVSLNLLVMGVAVALRPSKDMPILCDPFVLVCAFLSQFFVLGPIIAFVEGFTVLPFFTPPRPETMILTLFAFFVMTTFLILGHRIQLGVILANMVPGFGPSPRKLPGWWAESVVLVGSLVGCFGWLQSEGGLMAKLGSAYGSGSSIPLYTIAHVGLLAGTFLMAWRVINATTRHTMDAILLAALLAFDALFYGFVMGVRKYPMFLFFGMVAMWLLRRGVRTLPKFTTAVVLVILLVFFSVWGSIRGTPVSAMLGMSSRVEYTGASQVGMEAGYLTAICDPFGGACKVMEIFPEQEAFRHGSTLTIIFLGFIPRAIWPDKPVGIGKEITRYYEGPYYRQTGGLSMAPTLMGEFWVNFGWLGIVVGGFLLGVACRTVTAYATLGMKSGLQHQAARVLIPAVFIAGLGEVRADVAAMLLTWGLTGVPLLLGLTLFNLDGAPHAREALPVGGSLQGSRARG